MQHLTSLLKGLVLPHFVGKEARDLPQLVGNAYRLNSNYKYAGIPLWNCIGSVEIAVWDVLGKIIQRPVYQSPVKQFRREYPVYISDFNREDNPENAAQTRKYIPLLRKVLGDDITIYADANGSYTPREGIETKKMLEDPCNFKDEEGMKTVTKALSKIVPAGGEQDSSLYRFRRLAQENVYDLLQPDMYCNGGIFTSAASGRKRQKIRYHGHCTEYPQSRPGTPKFA